jgi:RNA polymerase sigma factor (sigma-70 family)
MLSVEALHQQCRTVVATLLAAYAWRLLTVDELTAAVMAQASAEHLPVPDQIRKWAIHLYCLQALYPASLGAHGSQAQQQAFAELASYLYRIAQRAWPTVAEDATQDALVAIYEKAAYCHNAGAFLAFAIQKLRDAARKRLRIGTRERSLDELLEEDAYRDAPVNSVSERAADAEVAPLIHELRRQVVDRLQTLRAELPRARRQLDAVWLRYIQEQSMEEIAFHLQTTVANVSVLLTRGLERLRQDPDLLALAADLSEHSGEK